MESRKSIEIQDNDRRTRRKRKKQNPIGRFAWHVLFFVMIALFLFSAAMIVRMFTRDELAGQWALDQITVYEFDGHGRGTLQLPLNSYDFSYRRNEQELTIDFDEDTATDNVYSYTVSDTSLELDNMTGNVFMLRKQ